MCRELSGIRGVTYYPETLARRKSFLVFCMFLCNLEQTVLLLFPCWGRKKNKKQTSALFLIAVLIYVPFLFFWNHISVYVSPHAPSADFPSVGWQMQAWTESPSNLTFSNIVIIWKITVCSRGLDPILAPLLCSHVNRMMWTWMPSFLRQK